MLTTATRSSWTVSWALRLGFIRMGRGFASDAAASSTETTANYYDILGITSDATSTEIREAFYREAKRVHPDVNPSPDAKVDFDNLRQAYKVLKNDLSRADYNRKFGIEKSLQQKKEDHEVYWETRSKFSPTRTWSAQLRRDMIRASNLRPIRRENARKKRGQGEGESMPPHERYIYEQHKGLFRRPEALDKFYFRSETPDRWSIYKRMGVSVALLCAIFGTYFYQEQGKVQKSLLELRRQNV